MFMDHKSISDWGCYDTNYVQYCETDVKYMYHLTLVVFSFGFGCFVTGWQIFIFISNNTNTCTKVILQGVK